MRTVAKCISLVAVVNLSSYKQIDVKVLLVRIKSSAIASTVLILLLR